MRQAIASILETIPQGYVFDSHFIIGRLLKEYSDVYLTFAGNVQSDSDRTLAVHGQVGLQIKAFEGVSIRKLNQPSWSENVHGRASSCTCWEKI